MDWLHEGDSNVTFTINGTVYHAGSDVGADTSLNTYIREYAHLKGTKYMCQEGGCGSCVVNMTATDPSTGHSRSFAVNSCLVPILACHGMSITTIEGIGNKKIGYHKVQKALFTFNGTQCGFCSPGQVMNMYSLLTSNPQIKMAEVENSFGGNICRCTGYRPILDAFKSLASDATNDLKHKLADIEDLVEKCTIDCKKECKECPKKEEVDSDYSDLFLETSMAPKNLWVSLKNGVIWYRVSDVFQVFQLFDLIGDSTYMLVAGNTAQGVYRPTALPNVYIDINDIRQLKTATVTNDHVILGGNITLSDMIALFNRLSSQNPLFYGYTKNLATHIDLVANVPVRNVGTLAGNLMIKHQHREFPSDIFLIMETSGARITIRDETGIEITMSLIEFLDTDMHKKLIINVILPALSSNHYYFRSFKTHAYHTEAILAGKSLLNSAVLNTAKFCLANEIQPEEESAEEASATYRKKLAIALFYKFILGVNGTHAAKEYRSGGPNLIRPLSSGKQEYPTTSSEPPVHLPKLKYEGLIQCSGEAEYVDDMPELPGQLYGALVITDRARAKIISVDASLATVSIISENVKYAGQPLGIIVAKTQHLANKAARFVRVHYSAVVKPLLTIKEVLESGDSSRVQLRGHVDPVAKKGNITHKIIGEFEMGSQYHYTLELQTCVCIPKEEGLDLYPSSQWMHNVQAAVAKSLGIQMNSINVKVKRVGGAYGAKITNSTLVACACSLAAHKLQKPVRTVVDLQTNTRSLGKRCMFLLKYEVGVDDNGQIQYLNADLYEDMGCTFSDNVLIFTTDGIKNCYDFSSWTLNFYLVKTDIPSTTWTRAPGTLEGMAAIEHIMEHIATVCKKDPLSVRRINFAESSSAMINETLQEVLVSSDYEKRLSAVNQYNMSNRWRKRGISVMPMKFDVIFYPVFHSAVSIFADDGTVAISSGGIEIGQGINTKVVQVCAYALGIDMNMIKIKPCYNVISPNDKPTAASIGTDTITYATLKCCEELNRRLKPIRDKLVNPSWMDIIKRANLVGVDLHASYMYNMQDPVPKPYSVYGATALEVEVDILTGQYQIVRADIVEDAGESLNPLMDLGQIEGAFIMGLGYLSSERIVYDDRDGALLTTRTWNYWPPGPKDIPIDFRVTIKKNATNPLGTLRSKATGEPPLCMSLTLINALRQAVKSARKNAGLKDEWFDFNPPCTFEKTFLTAGTSSKQYTL
ncbi:unnamed protein product [Nezara viridula]|uniref:Uncharacterized protein n=1 Tax=Nezara viridula TaxID=85310 RepID=A0A9P0HKB9_NEZVI|nr:unnamed protein product [Nezara viridula]